MPDVLFFLFVLLFAGHTLLLTMLLRRIEALEDDARHVWEDIALLSDRTSSLRLH